MDRTSCWVVALALAAAQPARGRAAEAASAGAPACVRAGVPASGPDLERLGVLRARLADPALGPRDRECLLAELKELEARLAVARRLRVAEPLRFKPAASGGASLAESLERAAADPEWATRAFDHGRASASPSVRPEAAAASPRSGSVAGPAAPERARSEAPPAPRGPSEAAPEPALAVVSRHVLRTEIDGQVVHAVGVAALLRRPDAAARTALSRELAREALAAAGITGEADPRRLALANFLRDVGEYAPAGAVGTYLSVDDEDHYRLLFRAADGGRRILSGRFLPGTGKEGDPDPGLVVMKPVNVDAAGRMTQERPGYWRRYTADDRRLEWGGVGSTETKGWGPWKHTDVTQRVALSEERWQQGRWQKTGERTQKTLTVSEGKSWLTRTEDRVLGTPVVGHVLKFCDDVAATLYTGIIGASQLAAGELLGERDLYSIEVGGSYAKNPLMARLVGDQGFLDRLTPQARRDLDFAVAENRRRALDAQAFPLPPELRRGLLDLPIRAPEAVATLREGYGAGTYGKRMLEAGAHEAGWRALAWSAGGVATGAVEQVSEAVFNPILWAMLGAGEAAQALRSVEAAGAATQAATAAVGAARATTTAAWWVPWVFNAADNAGRVVLLSAEARFDQAFLVKAAQAGADAMYLFVIP